MSKANFVQKVLKVKVNTVEIDNFVWCRNLGDLIIVVIDDNHHRVDNGDPESLDHDEGPLSLLLDQACKWPDTRAIGFFLLPPSPEDSDTILECIQNWLEGVGTSDRVYFLVDALYGSPGAQDFQTANRLMERLVKLYPDRAAYFTQAGVGRALERKLVKGPKRFRKGDQVEQLSQGLMSFFGKGWHKDRFINDAIQFYAKAWEPNWHPQGWAHDYLEGKNRDSPHLQALTEWLGDSVSIDDLVSNNTDQTESAKSLMIWHEGDLWGKENPPWKARGRRSIKGKVLNAVLENLGIPLSKTNGISDEGLITMPCVPCFPFLVSLQGFLWCCEEEEDKISVSELCFFQLGKKPQVNVFRLVLPLKEPVMLAKKFFGIGEERSGAFTNSLRNLTCCRTDGLMGHGDYMPLFTNGTESPVVAVEIAPGQINLIWSVG